MMISKYKEGVNGLFCPNCGSKLPDQAAFCGVCGFSIEQHRKKMENEDSNKRSSGDVRQHKKKILWIIIAVMVIMILGVVAAIIVIRSQNEEKEPEKKSETEKIEAVVENVINSILNSDYNRLLNYVPDEVYENYSKMNKDRLALIDVKNGTDLKRYLQANCEELMGSSDVSTGEVQYQFEVINTEMISKEEFLADTKNDEVSFITDMAESYAKVDVNMQVSVMGITVDDDYNEYCYKFDGNWYPASAVFWGSELQELLDQKQKERGHGEEGTSTEDGGKVTTEEKPGEPGMEEKPDLTKEEAYGAVVMHTASRDVIDAMIRGEYCVWSCEDTGNNTFEVSFHSYTGEVTLYHVDLHSGEVTAYDNTNGNNREHEKADAGFNARDYLENKRSGFDPDISGAADYTWRAIMSSRICDRNTYHDETRGPVSYRGWLMDFDQDGIPELWLDERVDDMRMDIYTSAVYTNAELKEYETTPENYIRNIYAGNDSVIVESYIGSSEGGDFRIQFYQMKDKSFYDVRTFKIDHGYMGGENTAEEYYSVEENGSETGLTYEDFVGRLAELGITMTGSENKDDLYAYTFDYAGTGLQDIKTDGVLDYGSLIEAIWEW